MALYSQIIKESTLLHEMIPWRSSKVPIYIGRTAMDGMKQDCIVLNNLKFIMTFKPSFMFVLPDIKLIQKDGGGTNGWLITARNAQQLEYSITKKGMCSAYTYFMGRPKQGRVLDWIQRIFERGFSLENINIGDFPDGAVVDITASKKHYHSTGFISGKQYGKGDPTSLEHKVPVRFTTKVKKPN